MSKRERSPESTDAGADDRPSKRAAAETMLATQGNGDHQHSEDLAQQTGVLTLDSPATATQRHWIAGPGPSIAQADGDVEMAVDENNVPPEQEVRIQKSNFQSIMQQPRSQSLPNTNLSNPYPYGGPRRNVDGSPGINVVPATPAASQLFLPLNDASPSLAGSSFFVQNDGLQAHRYPRGTPPLTEMYRGGPLIPRIPSPTIQTLNAKLSVTPLPQYHTKSKRVAFGPRLDCEKCRLGENHFAHVQYE